MKKLFLTLVATAMALGLSVDSAQARKPYLDEFLALYPNVAAAKESKCAVCHAPDSKKVRNDYGKAVGKALGMPNVKDAAEIKKALETAAKDNPDFDKALKAGELPVK